MPAKYRTAAFAFGCLHPSQCNLWLCKWPLCPLCGILIRYPISGLNPRGKFKRSLMKLARRTRVQPLSVVAATK